MVSDVSDAAPDKSFMKGLNSPAANHLADAVLHLRRCLLAIKAATVEQPALVVALGSRYARLAEELRELQQLQGADRGWGRP